MRWSPKNYLDNTGDKSVRKCPCCGASKLPACLVDVSGLPDELTGGFDYACDGCWTQWIETGETMNGEALTRKRWVAALGASQEHTDQISDRSEAPSGRKARLG